MLDDYMLCGGCHVLGDNTVCQSGHVLVDI